MYTTRCKIVGCGTRHNGVTKEGNSYDFVEVAFTYPSKMMNGVMAASCIIDTSEFDRYNIVPGCEVDAFIFYRNHKPYIAGIVGRV